MLKDNVFDTRLSRINYWRVKHLIEWRKGPTWVIILLVRVLIVHRVHPGVAQIWALRRRGGQAGTWGKYFRVIKYFSVSRIIFLGANDVLLFYDLSMWIEEQMLRRIPGSSLSHALSLWVPKYDCRHRTILGGDAGSGQVPAGDTRHYRP